MKLNKIGLFLFCIILLISCAKEDPTKNFDKQIQQIQTFNNRFINKLNTLSKQQFESIQTQFEQDLNQETLSADNSEILKVINTKKESLLALKTEQELFEKEVTLLNELDVTKLDRASTQFDSVKTTVGEMLKNQHSLIESFEKQLQAEEQLVPIMSKADPSMQELETQLSLINEQRNMAHTLLESYKSNNTEAQTNINSWREAIAPKDENDDQTASEDINETEAPTPVTPVVEPEPEKIEPKYTVDNNFRVIPINENDSPKVALLTFDDAIQPQPNSYSLEIAKTLKEKGVSAIFFVNGMFLEDDFGKQQLKEIYDLGFTIGNHTYDHPNLSQIDLEKTRNQIKKTNDLVEEITGERPKIFRPTFGIMGKDTQSVLDEEGMIWFNWTYGYDWEKDYMEAAPLADIMVNSPYLGNGANLLMHDRKWTSEAIGQIVDGLVEKGYTIINPNEIKIPSNEVSHVE